MPRHQRLAHEFVPRKEVVKDAMKVCLLTSAGLIDAKVVQVDAANDLALLKAEVE